MCGKGNLKDCVLLGCSVFLLILNHASCKESTVLVFDFVSTEHVIRYFQLISVLFFYTVLLTRVQFFFYKTFDDICSHYTYVLFESIANEDSFNRTRFAYVVTTRHSTNERLYHVATHKMTQHLVDSPSVSSLAFPYARSIVRSFVRGSRATPSFLVTVF